MQNKEVFAHRVLSDDDGEYVFSMLPAGTYEIRAFHRDYAAASRADIQITQDQVLNGIDITLSSGLTLRGNVINEKKEPIENATISVSKKTTRINPSGGMTLTGRFSCGQSTTKSDGSFTLEHVPGGEILLSAIKEGYSETVLPLKLSEGKEPASITLILKQTAEIGGTVVDTEDGAIVSAEVSVLKYTEPNGETYTISDKKGARSVTNQGGGFLLKGLLADSTYDIKVKATGYPETVFPGIKTGTHANKLVLDVGGSIAGKVTMLTDKKPAAGIRVVVRRKEGPSRFSGSALTDPNGDYRVSELPKGTYDVQIDSTIYTSSVRENIKVEPGKNVTGIHFTIYRGLQIQGEVVDSVSKTGISDAKVYVQGQIAGGGTKKLSTVSSQNGWFSFDNLPPEIYIFYSIEYDDVFTDAIEEFRPF